MTKPATPAELRRLCELYGLELAVDSWRGRDKDHPIHPIFGDLYTVQISRGSLMLHATGGTQSVAEWQRHIEEKFR